MTHTRDIFLDHAATTPLHPEALGLMLPYFGNHFGTPAMPFGFGDKPRAALDQARSRVARLIGACPQEIIFTSSGTEANNLAILGLASAQKGKRHIITSAIEHISVLNTLRHLKETGFEVTELGVDEHGIIDPANIESAIRDDTFLISIMHACNETGAIQDIEAIGRIAHSRGIAFHCDSVQSEGKVPIQCACNERYHVEYLLAQALRTKRLRCIVCERRHGHLPYFLRIEPGEWAEAGRYQCAMHYRVRLGMREGLG